MNLFVFEALGYGDIKGTKPGDKDYDRMWDIMKKSKGDDGKALALVQKMANAIARGSGSSSSDKAFRRAEAAMFVFKGKLGRQMAKIFMDAISGEQRSA